MENLGLLKPADSSEKTMVLDLGCGKGFDAEYMTSLGYNVLAVDKEKHYEKAVIADIQTFKIDPNKYAYIICNNVLPFISNKTIVENIINKIVAGLQHKGVAFFTLYGPNSARYPNPEMSFYTFEEAYSLVRNLPCEIMDMTSSQGYSKNGKGEIIYQHSHRFLLQKK